MCSSRPLLAQISEGGTPYSFGATLKDEVPAVNMAPVNVQALLAEDAQAQRSPEPIPFRYGYPLDVQLGLDNAGTWTDLPDGGRLWRLRIVSPGAKSINLIYDRFEMLPGGQFFVYNPDRSMVLGAFTANNNSEEGVFSTAQS